MNQRAIIVAVILFVAIVGGMFAYARMKSAELQTVIPVPEAPKKEEPESITRIDAKEYFSGKTYTVAGKIMLPTPCDLLESKATVSTSTPEQVAIAFDVINNSGGACAQVITEQRFKVRFDASKDAVITATWKGVPVTLNLVEAGPNENPDDFELFIKG
jgi:hypothetical protein